MAEQLVKQLHADASAAEQVANQIQQKDEHTQLQPSASHTSATPKEMLQVISRKPHHIASPSYDAIKLLSVHEVHDLLDYGIKLLSFHEPMDLPLLKQLYQQSTADSTPAVLLQQGATVSNDITLATINCRGLDTRWLDAAHVFSIWRLLKKRGIAILSLQEIDAGAKKSRNRFVKRFTEALNSFEEEQAFEAKMSKEDIAAARGRFSSVECWVGSGHNGEHGMQESLGWIYDTRVAEWAKDVDPRNPTVLLTNTGSNVVIGDFSITVPGKIAMPLKIPNVHAPSVSGSRSAWCGDLLQGINLDELRMCDFITGDFNMEPEKLLAAFKKELPECKTLPNASPTKIEFGKLPARTAYDYFVQIDSTIWSMVEHSVHPDDHRLRNGEGEVSSQLLSDHLIALMKIRYSTV